MLVVSSSLEGQIVCPRGVDCQPQPWTAQAIHRAAPGLTGCWSFQLSGGQSLQSPLPQSEYVFPLTSKIELTMEEVQDVWPDFEGVRHEIAFRVRGLDLKHAAYWIPDPDGDAFLLKWREEGSTAGHFVLRARIDGTGGTATVSEPFQHGGIVLRPYEIRVARCSTGMD